MQDRGFVVVAVLLALAAGVWFAIDRTGGPHLPTAGSPAGSPATADPKEAPVAPASAAVPPAAGAAAEPRANGAERERIEAGDPAAGRTAVVRGRVVDRSGAPRADVELRLTSWSGADDLEILPLPVDQGRGQGRGPTARTDRNGRFEFALASGRAGSVALTSTDFVFARGNPHVPTVHEDVDLGDLVALKAAMIAGTVHDRRGQPVADVTVAAGRDGMPLGFHSSSKTDAEGRFEIAALGAGTWHLRTASSSHLPASQVVELREEERHTGADFVLEQGLAIAGQVVDDRGLPVAGIKVGSKRHEVRGDVEVDRFTPDEATTTDAGGYFTLAGLQGGAVSVRAFGPGYAPAVAGNVAVGTGNLRLLVQRLGSVAGVLRDPDGRPIAGSRVQARGGRGGAFGGAEPPAEFALLGEAAAAVTAADGTFRIDGVHPGTVVVSAQGKAHRPARRDGIVVQPAQQVDGVVLVADLGAAVRVEVVADDGTPVAGAKVVVSEPRSSEPAAGGRFGRRVSIAENDSGDVRVLRGGRQEFGTATTDAHGVAEIAGLPAGPATLSASDDQHAESRPADVVLPARGAVEQRLVLRKPGFAELTVVGADGAPAAASYVVRGPEAAGEDGREHAGRTGADGRSRVGPLPAGDYRAVLRLEPRGRDLGGALIVDGAGHDLEATQVSFRVAAGETTPVQLLVPVLARVHGTVRDASGPAGGVAIELEPLAGPGPGRQQVRSAADGTYAIDDVEPGRYRLRYGKPGQVVKAGRELTVAANETDLQVDLELRYGKLRVQAVARDGGQGIEGVEVELVEGGAAAAPRREQVMMFSISSNGQGGGEATTMTIGGARARTGADGVAEIGDVPPGTYTARLHHDSYAERELADQVVAEASTTDAGRVELDAAGSLRGRVVGADGQQVGMAMVHYRRQGAAHEDRRQPALGGAFTLRGLAAGRYTLWAEALGEQPGRPGPEVETDVAAGRTGDVELRAGPR